MNKYKINGAMSRKEIALLYNISDKAFNARLKRHGLDFGNDRVLLPAQIERIIDVLGFWVIELAL
ncbi:hypothetical protein [Runella sp.]|jgi:hypothetical protein|uniref:hypothetical protein n=1 Tax=Runella sp. TaxID=1960881 RepID=UPI0026070B03|nr:hypothetical protein [Runella sp.]